MALQALSWTVCHWSHSPAHAGSVACVSLLSARPLGRSELRHCIIKGLQATTPPARIREFRCGGNKTPCRLGISSLKQHSLRLLLSFTGE
ncbi:hypothetical protein BV20DRAFT_968736 [Pilatotrama ljubarskyi]|nr:hypothetical protein BV20DRAFT_968736 [Pilatotrama ljubarskyi]